VRDAGLNATWFSQAHHEFQRAAQGNRTLDRLKSFMGKDLVSDAIIQTNGTW
jgi:hypothetical protein